MSRVGSSFPGRVFFRQADPARGWALRKMFNLYFFAVVMRGLAVRSGYGWIGHEYIDFAAFQCIQYGTKRVSARERPPGRKRQVVLIVLFRTLYFGILVARLPRLFCDKLVFCLSHNPGHTIGIPPLIRDAGCSVAMVG